MLATVAGIFTIERASKRFELHAPPLHVALRLERDGQARGGLLHHGVARYAEARYVSADRGHSSDLRLARTRKHVGVPKGLFDSASAAQCAVVRKEHDLDGRVAPEACDKALLFSGVARKVCPRRPVRTS